MLKKIIIDQIRQENKISKAGKQYTSCGIKAQGENNWMNGFGSLLTANWKTGDEVELDVYEEEYMGKMNTKFKVPTRTAGLERRVEILESQVKTLMAMLKPSVASNLPLTGSSPRDRAMEAMEAQKLANMVGGRVVPPSEEPDWANPPKEEIKVEDIPF